MALETASASIQDLFIFLKINYKDILVSPSISIHFFSYADFRVTFMKCIFNYITLLFKSF